MADMTGKTEAALEWAKTWPHLDGFLKLNAILTEGGDASFNTVFSDSAGQPFIDGTSRHQYTFALKMVLPWSDGYDQSNAEAERLMEEWRDWVDDQYPDNVPAWPGAEIEAIEALYDVPSVMVYQEESVAEYMLQAQITYTE